ncbi:hypothetical protein FVEN_g8171 [Fusarium venenatum]|uniref:Uncharacterized protein n=1 Tax=Fusarium venenatum TaxID=56646 RepID=A0A2L2SYR7_9HYPO|nr:uncharacterized protein FVRRES_04469 [Fusarium venenatum]KAG8353790.1 hypothetical protein FVEN_g8171 [Fusarium venenatum]KAH6991634.1 hypothetical protein EDB82DRAFT_458919 [Fusarium venenatum]CEI60033.1 unnamed protein product [Fusarium venenatum]
MGADSLVKFAVRPDGRIITHEPTLTLQYDKWAEEMQTLSVPGEHLPRYAIKRLTKCGGARGHKFEVYSTTDKVQRIACIKQQSMPPRIQINLTQADYKLKIKTHDSSRQYDAAGGLGRLYWKSTSTKACWKLKNNKGLVLLVTIDESKTNGIISIYKKHLENEVIEELLAVAVAQIEDYNRITRASERSAGRAP